MKIQFRPTTPPPQQTEGISSTSQSSASGKSSPLGNFKTAAGKALQRVQSAVSSGNEKIKTLLQRTAQKLQAMKAKITGNSSSKQPVNPYGDNPVKGQSSSSTRSQAGPGDPPNFKPEPPNPERSNAAPPPPPPPPPSGPDGKNPIQASDLARQAGNLKPTVTNDRSAPILSSGGPRTAPTPPPKPSTGPSMAPPPPPPQSSKPPQASSAGPSASPPPPPPPRPSVGSSAPPPPPPPPSAGPGGPSLIKAEDLAAQAKRLKPVSPDKPGPKAPTPTAPKPNVGPAPTPEKGKAPQFVMTQEVLSGVKLKSTKE